MLGYWQVRKERVSLPGGTWGCLDSRRFGYEHVVRSQMSHPLSATQILGATTFQRDGSLHIQVLLSPISSDEKLTQLQRWVFQLGAV